MPDFIEEVAFLRNRGASSTGFAKVVDSGMTKVGKKKLGWIAQEYCNIVELSKLIHMKNVISLSNALKIIRI